MSDFMRIGQDVSEEFMQTLTQNVIDEPKIK